MDVAARGGRGGWRFERTRLQGGRGSGRAPLRTRPRTAAKDVASTDTPVALRRREGGKAGGTLKTVGMSLWTRSRGEWGQPPWTRPRKVRRDPWGRLRGISQQMRPRGREQGPLPQTRPQDGRRVHRLCGRGRLDARGGQPCPPRPWPWSWRTRPWPRAPPWRTRPWPRARPRRTRPWPRTRPRWTRPWPEPCPIARHGRGHGRSLKSGRPPSLSHVVQSALTDRRAEPATAALHLAGFAATPQKRRVFPILGTY